ncbi:MAG TPA: hypothetical protein VIT91_09965 [Chthoniobacterales bacterium]
MKRLLIVQTLLAAALIFQPEPEGVAGNAPLHLYCERCKRPALTWSDARTGQSQIMETA